MNFNGKKIIIFGGSGFIGKHLINKLSRFSCNIEIISRSPKDIKLIKFLGELGQIDINTIDDFSEESVLKLINDADVVINLIGILYENKYQTFENVHISIPEIIAKCAKKLNVEKFIHLSALGVNKQTESKYASSKFHGEEIVLKHYSDAIIIRPSVVFGDGDGFINLFNFLSKISPFLPLIGTPKILKKKRFFPIFNFKEGVNFQPIYVGDLVEFIIHSCSVKGMIYDLAGPNILSFKEILLLILKYNKRKRLLFPMPIFAARILSLFLERLPKPILTSDQVKLLEKDNISEVGIKNLKKFVKFPKSLEVVLPTYIF